MRLLLAGMTLACLGHVAHAQTGRYSESDAAAAAPESAPVAEAGQPAAAPAEAADAHADLKNMFDGSPAPTMAAPPAGASEPTPAGNPFGAPAPAASAAAELGPAAGPAASAAAHTPPAAAAALEPAATDQRSLLTKGPKPSKMMQDLMKAPAAATLTGTPVTLGEAVRDSRTRQDQTQRAKAYWDLAAATADYYLALLETQELATLRAGVSIPGQQWDARGTELANRVELAKKAAQSAQLQLHTLLGGGASSLPLPADVPHCGRYNAEYEEIFAQRQDLTAKKLAEVLSLRHAELRDMTQAIEDAEAFRALVSANRNPSGDGSDLLAAQQLLSLQRRAFVARAREYNQEIAAYTELAAPAEVPADRLVAMMIRVSTTTDQLNFGQGGIEPVAATEPVTPTEGAEATKKNDETPSTFAERHQEVRRPLQRLLGRERERSIVVRRLREVLDRD
ncbi:hypothetical protein [Lacipirellula parvula]|uniref:Uncharacterized protein n=1 Tax=Lacipirellula parvula TaxID=2650471 RepID=A0A5K7X9K9_9BACT|nr:hypothetical protein [Lacipirellula parvula]BBO33218.1 hypothetical protein PLANPX_2830 [Lacipirellula parvula]